METTSTVQKEEEKTTTMRKSFSPQKHLGSAVHGEVSNRVALFRDKAEALSKPTPEWSITPEDPLYARPATGGRKVRHHNFNHDVNDAVQEVIDLCNVIKQSGQKNSTDGTIQITFGQLFDIYVNISSKLMGTLLRARKYNYLTFKGELLLQHRDENVIIQLLNKQ